MRVIVGAKVHTMTEPAEAEAIAWDAGKIVAVGRRDDVLKLAGPGSEIESLKGRAITPGFIDAHHHMSIALLFACAPNVGPARAKNHDDIARLLRNEAATLSPGAWVVAYGYDEWQLAERKPPTREFLDSVCPEHPAFLFQYSYHEGVANSRALGLAGIGRETSDPPGGRIVRDRRGEPTGHLIETAMAPVETRARSALTTRHDEEIIERIDGYERELFATGITRIGDAACTPDLEALYRRAYETKSIRIPVVINPVGPGGQIAGPLERLDRDPTGSGPETMRIGALKLIFDGGDQCALCMSFGELAGAVAGAIGRAASERSFAPFAAARRLRVRIGRDLRFRQGLLFFDEERARQIAERAVERGFALMIHCMGNEAADLGLATLAHVRKRHPAAIPPRIEHAFILSDAQISRARDEGIALVPQPSFVELADSGVALLPGYRMLGLRSMIDAGITVAGSSDHPVVSFDPLAAMRCAVRRRTPRGREFDLEQAVKPMDVVRMYTVGSATAVGSLDVTGTLEPGKRADFVVLSADPAAPDVDLDALAVEATVLGGHQVYRRTPAARA